MSETYSTGFWWDLPVWPDHHPPFHCWSNQWYWPTCRIFALEWINVFIKLQPTKSAHDVTPHKVHNDVAEGKSHVEQPQPTKDVQLITFMWIDRTDVPTHFTIGKEVEAVNPAIRVDTIHEWCWSFRGDWTCNVLLCSYLDQKYSREYRDRRKNCKTAKICMNVQWHIKYHSILLKYCRCFGSKADFADFSNWFSSNAIFGCCLQIMAQWVVLCWQNILSLISFLIFAINQWPPCG